MATNYWNTSGEKRYRTFGGKRRGGAANRKLGKMHNLKSGTSQTKNEGVSFREAWFTRKIAPEGTH